MKANYLPKSRLKHPDTKRVLILVAVFILGVISFSLFKSVIISATLPIWQAENVVMRNLRKGADFFTRQNNLIKEKTALQERVSLLETEVFSLSGARGERDTLLELLGRRIDPEMIAASALTHPPQTPYDVIMIDAGLEEGLILDSEVYLPEGPMIGRVSEIFSKRARVTLFSTNQEKTSAVLERDGSPVILVGLGGGNFRFSVSRDVVVERGDRIFSPDLVPHLLAVVGEVNVRPTDSFKEGLAKSPTNIFIIRYVLVKP